MAMRFAVDDEVLCCLQGSFKRANSGTEWVKAVVVHVQPEEMPDVAYQCRRTDNGGLVWVKADTDEFVSKPGVSPLERLMDSIEQRCSVQHLEFIVQEHGIQMPLVAERLTRKAALSGHGEAFFWLKRNWDIDLKRCKGPKRRNVLHMFAAAEEVNFFWELARRVREPDFPRLKSNVKEMLVETDADGQTLLHIAASRAGKQPALLRVLLSRQGLGMCLSSASERSEMHASNPVFSRLYYGNVSCWKDARGRTASDICRLLKNKGDVMLRKFQMQVAYSTIFGEQSLFTVKDPPLVAVKWFEEEFGDIIDPKCVAGLEEQETFVQFRAKFGRCEEIRFMHDRLGVVDIHRGEQGVPQVVEGIMSRDVKAGLPRCYGVRESLAIRKLHAKADPAIYQQWDGGNLEAFLDERIASSTGPSMSGGRLYEDPTLSLWRYKQKLFLPDSDLEPHEGRLRLLEWLLVDIKMTISPVLAVENHRPEMLRRMVEVGYLDLSSPPDVESRAHAASRAWLRHPNAPASTAKKGKKQPSGCATAGELLAVLCAGYGVVLGLTLILETAPEAAKASYGGMNLLHVAAKQGQTEVVALLVKRKLVPCTDFAGSMNAAHMAFRAGLDVTGWFLLEQGCAEVDRDGRDFTWHMEASGYEDTIRRAAEVKDRRQETVCLNKLKAVLEKKDSGKGLSRFVQTCKMTSRSDEFKKGVVALGVPVLRQAVVAFGLEGAKALHRLLVETVQIGFEDYRDGLGKEHPDLMDNEFFKVTSSDCDFVTGVMLQSAADAGQEDTLAFLRSTLDVRRMDRALHTAQSALQNMVVCGADVEVLQEQIATIVAFNVPHHESFKDSMITPRGELAKANSERIFRDELHLLPWLVKTGFTHLVEWVMNSAAASRDDAEDALILAAQNGLVETICVLFTCGQHRLQNRSGELWLRAFCEAAGFGHLPVVELCLAKLREIGYDVNKGPCMSDRKSQSKVAFTVRKNALERASEYYIAGETHERVPEEHETETTLWEDGTVEDLTADHSGNERLPVLRCLLAQNAFDLAALPRISQSLLSSRTNDDGTLCHEHGLRCARLMNVVRMLVAGGAKPAELLRNTLEDVQFEHVMILRTMAEEYHVDVQEDVFRRSAKYSFDKWPLWQKAKLQLVREAQRHRWAWIDQLEEGAGIAELQGSEQANCKLDATVKDRRGRAALHVAASCSSVEVVRWLVEELGVTVHELDAEGRTAAELAKAAGNSDVHLYLQRWRAERIVANFTQCRWKAVKARRELKLAVKSAKKIQARWRCWKVQVATREQLKRRVRQRQGFMAVWGEVVKMLNSRPTPGCVSWDSVREQAFDFAREGGTEEDDEVDGEGVNDRRREVEEATAASLAAADTDGQGHENAEDDRGGDEIAGVEGGKCEQGAGGLTVDDAALDRILLTAEALRWYRLADVRQSELFLQRLRQVGSRNFSIFETYLDQGHTAQRILWTECRERGELRRILVWCVAKHKHVSRCMLQIDQAAARLNRQLQSARNLVETEVEEGSEQERGDALELDGETVLLDPRGNTPLKIHEADISSLAAKESLDSLPLRLTDSERAVVERGGTVLVLGRSGTGKTVCIANKMAVDRAARGPAITGRQLFVCRSRKVCTLVQRLQGLPADGAEACFLQLDALVNQTLHRVSAERRYRFATVRRIDFPRFHEEWRLRLGKGSSLAALVVWTQIQSFIKGSMEAVAARRPLLEEEYLQLGEDRVRISAKQRREAYAAYQRYQKWCGVSGGWDEGDRMLAVLGCMEGGDGEGWGRGEFHKVYVDEAQDLTQAQVAFLFKHSGSNSLFMAGDPAQSVEEGVDFRFSEVRQVAYALGVPVPDKPLSLLLNFRSHSGILDLAKALLHKLFSLFPGAAAKLPPDEGLYRGPRPGLLRVDPGELGAVLGGRAGLVVLAAEQSVAEVRRVCGEQLLVLGVREAKGLEFKEVAVVDFCCGMSRELQQRFKEMLAAEQHGKGDGLRYRFPELETVLKVLYTAVTRAEQKLFLIETRSSVAGNALFRFLKERQLANEQQVLEAEQLLTPDEWLARGLDMAIMASEASSVDEEITWVKRAITCFENGRNSEMVLRGQAHLESARVRQACLEADPGGARSPTKQEEEVEGRQPAQVTWQTEAAEAARSCVESGMWEELGRLVRHVLPRMPERAEVLVTQELLVPLGSRLTAAPYPT